MDLSSFPSGKGGSGWESERVKLSTSWKLFEFWTPGDAVQDRTLKASSLDIRSGEN